MSFLSLSLSKHLDILLSVFQLFGLSSAIILLKSQKRKKNLSYKKSLLLINLQVVIFELLLPEHAVSELLVTLLQASNLLSQLVFIKLILIIPILNNKNKSYIILIRKLILFLPSYHQSDYFSCSFLSSFPSLPYSSGSAF